MNMKTILVEHGTKKEIMRIFKCTYPTIRTALNYKNNTPLASKIRQTALNKGGKLVESINQ